MLVRVLLVAAVLVASCAVALVAARPVVAFAPGSGAAAAAALPFVQVLTAVPNTPFSTYLSITRYTWNVTSGVVSTTLAPLLPSSIGAYYAFASNFDLQTGTPYTSQYALGFGLCAPGVNCTTQLFVYSYYTASAAQFKGFAATCTVPAITTVFYNSTGYSHSVFTCGGGTEPMTLWQGRFSSGILQDSKPVTAISPPRTGRWASYASDNVGTFVLDLVYGFSFIDPQTAVARPLAFTGFTIAAPTLISISRPGLFVIVGRDRQMNDRVRLVQAMLHGATVMEFVGRASVDLPFVDVSSIQSMIVPGTDQPYVSGFTYNGTQQEVRPRRFLFFVDLSLEAPIVTFIEQDTKKDTSLWHGVARFLF